MVSTTLCSASYEVASVEQTLRAIHFRKSLTQSAHRVAYFSSSGVHFPLLSPGGFCFLCPPRPPSMAPSIVFPAAPPEPRPPPPPLPLLLLLLLLRTCCCWGWAMDWPPAPSRLTRGLPPARPPEAEAEDDDEELALPLRVPARPPPLLTPLLLAVAVATASGEPVALSPLPKAPFESGDGTSSAERSPSAHAAACAAACNFRGGGARDQQRAWFVTVAVVGAAAVRSTCRLDRTWDTRRFT